MHDERTEDNGRIARVENTITQLSGELRQHVIDEGEVFDEFRVSIERLAVTAEMHTKLMDRMSNTLDSLALQNTRIVVVEEFRARTEAALRDLQERTSSNTDTSNAMVLERTVIVKVFALLSTAAAACWAVFTYFFK